MPNTLLEPIVEKAWKIVAIATHNVPAVVFPLFNTNKSNEQKNINFKA